MVYNKPLPRIDKVLALSELVKSFPATVREIAELAKTRGFSQSLQDFIRLFPDDGTFEDADDFLSRCQELEVLIHEERKAQYEFLRSP